MTANIQAVSANNVQPLSHSEHFNLLGKVKRFYGRSVSLCHSLPDLFLKSKHIASQAGHEIALTLTNAGKALEELSVKHLKDEEVESTEEPSEIEESAPSHKHLTLEERRDNYLSLANIVHGVALATLFLGASAWFNTPIPFLGPILGAPCLYTGYNLHTMCINAKDMIHDAFQNPVKTIASQLVNAGKDLLIGEKLGAHSNEKICKSLMKHTIYLDWAKPGMMKLIEEASRGMQKGS